MNKRMLSALIIMPLIFCSCSKKALNPTSGTVSLTAAGLQTNQAEKLPEDFTIDKVKNALAEYINYRLWLYPAKIFNDTSDKALDNYINSSIDVEIRAYNNCSEKSVYAYTNVGKWLAVFKVKDGFVYCDGQVNKGEYGWPSDAESYKVIEKYSMLITPPHKPAYGTSQRKDKMLAALEANIKTSCEDFYKGADKNYTEWLNVDVYIADFYEYENAAHAWLCRKDGSITNYPVNFEERDNEIKVIALKSFSLKSKNDFNESGIFQFDKDIADAVKHFKCNIQ